MQLGVVGCLHSMTDCVDHIFETTVTFLVFIAVFIDGCLIFEAIHCIMWLKLILVRGQCYEKMIPFISPIVFGLLGGLFIECVLCAFSLVLSPFADT